MSTQFSIIIPVYNVVSELTRAVESVQKQDFADWEIILVDDGSTDGSGELCDRLSREDDHIRVLHQRNGGVVAARQAGFKASHGGWILFLDGDDELAPDILSAADVFIKADDTVDIVIYGFQMIRSQNEKVNHLPTIAEGIWSSESLIRNAQDTPMKITEMCIWNKIYNREICVKTFSDVGDLHIKHSEDGLFALSALLNSAKIGVMNRVGYFYRLRKGSAVHRFNPDIVAEKELFIDRAMALMSRSPFVDERKLRDIRLFHSYEAVGYIYMHSLRARCSLRQVYLLLNSVRLARFFLDAKSGCQTLGRRLKIFLMSRPICFIAYRCIFRIRRRFLCE